MQYRAAAALRHADVDRASSGLREQLRLMAATTRSTALWATMTVDGPFPVADRDGSTWFEWAATITVTGGRDEVDDDILDRLVAVQRVASCTAYGDTARQAPVRTD